MKAFNLTKLKIITKRLLGKCVYMFTYIQKKCAYQLQKHSLSQLIGKKNKKTLSEIFTTILKQWRFFGTVFLGIVFIYYTLGAFISSDIKNSLETNLTIKNKQERYLPLALNYTLKTQIDDSVWVPALPIFFPASILDNMPNFQVGAKESAKYFIKNIAIFHSNKQLKEAGGLLDYPADIWLFSQTEKDKLAPGSAKQYRKAIALIKSAYKDAPELSIKSNKELAHMLNSINKLLNLKVTIMQKYILEHNSDLIDTKVDDIFYQTKGTIYVIYYVLQALEHDYQDIITSTGQYENMISALNLLKDAENLNPTIIRNSSPQNIFSANHLMYLAYYLAQAQNIIYKIIPAITENQEE